MLIKWTLKGKTLVRILTNDVIGRYTEKNPIKGKTIDLGSKSDNMSYNQFLKKEENCEITYTDLRPESDNVLKIDLEKRFPIDDESYDTVMCFNTLEHIYDFKNVISESHRIIKKGGKFIGTTPLMVAYHADPDDYFRYTHTALKRMFEEEGFELIKMEKLGYGPFSTGLYYVVMLAPRLIRPILLLGCISLDKILNFLTNNRHTGKAYTLFHFMVFEKK